jgi:hypothetical protein
VITLLRLNTPILTLTLTLPYPANHSTTAYPAAYPAKLSCGDPRKQFIEAKINIITSQLQALGLRGYPPLQEEVMEVIGPSTASPAILERIGARKASRKAKRTAVRSQKARNAIKTAIEAENAMEATVEATTTRSGRSEKEGAVGGVRRAHSKLKISAAEANGSYDKLHF